MSSTHDTIPAPPSDAMCEVSHENPQHENLSLELQIEDRSWIMCLDCRRLWLVQGAESPLLVLVGDQTCLRRRCL